MTDKSDKSDNLQASTETTVYECQACGWLYPNQREASEQRDTTVPFAELPDSFACPLCGVEKSEFKVVDMIPLQVEEDVATSTINSSASIEVADMKDSFDDDNHAKENADLNSSSIVIIGAGLAGWGVVDAIRAKDKEVDITMITADNGDRYHKPMLSAAFSQNKSLDDLIRFKGEDASQTANIKLLTHTKVKHIDSVNKVVQTDKGSICHSNIRYNDLIIAMGATPAMPPSLAKVSSDKIWHINDLATFAKVQHALNNQTKHIAVVGAGMVGTEIAEDLTKAGHKVTLLDMNEAPLALMLPPIATSKIKQALQAQGIEFLGGSRVTEVMSNSVDSDTVSDGFTLHIIDANNQKKTLDVDHILVSTGLKVDSALPISAGVDFDARTGIAVDEKSLQTSQPNIYAIGDCMSINSVACRYVAPLRAQAATIAEHILYNKTEGYEHKAYQHKYPMIRLKNKSISVSATGTPTANENNGIWRIVSETQTATHNEMVLEQVSDSDDVVATVTLKIPNF